MNWALSFEPVVQFVQVRLGLNPQADHRRTLKRPQYAITQPGHFSGPRLFARGFTPGRTLALNHALIFGPVRLAQVRLGQNPQADHLRTLKRPQYAITQPGRFSGLRPLARGFTPGRTLALNHALIFGPVRLAQVRLAQNPQADHQRMLKRPKHASTFPGRFSGLRPLARGFTPGRALFAESDELQTLIVEDLEGLL